MTVLLLIFAILFSSPAFAENCRALSYIADDFQHVVDSDGDMSSACKAAEKSATWKACVICAGDEERNQHCYFKQSYSSPDKSENYCSAQAEAVSQFCESISTDKSLLVHCEN